MRASYMIDSSLTPPMYILYLWISTGYRVFLPLLHFCVISFFLHGMPSSCNAQASLFLSQIHKRNFHLFLPYTISLFFSFSIISFSFVVQVCLFQVCCKFFRYVPLFNIFLLGVILCTNWL